MSHFIFGVVEGGRTAARQNIGDVVDVCWGAVLQQNIVIEMLRENGKPDMGETPFCIVSAGEDNADALVSPYQVDRQRIIESLRHMLSWLDQERAGKRAELWITEGYDDAFKVFEGPYEELHRLVQEVLLQTEDLPSLRMMLTVDPGRA